MRVGGVPEHFNLPWYSAIESGKLPNVDWIDHPSGTGAMMDALSEGELDVAVALTEGAVQAITGGLDARIVGVSIPSALQWGVHVAASSTFQDLSDLVGTRAAISRRGSGSHLMAYVLADRLDWAPDTDDHFVEIGTIDGARQALAANDAEFFLWDRFMTQPVVDAGEFRRVGVQPTPWPAFVIVARSQLLADERPVLDAVLTTVAATAATLSARSDVVDLVAKRFHLRPEIAQACWDVTDWADAGAQVTAAQLHDVQTTLLRLGRIDVILEADRLLA